MFGFSDPRPGTACQFSVTASQVINVYESGTIMTNELILNAGREEG